MDIGVWLGQLEKASDLGSFVTEAWRMSEEDDTLAFLRQAALLDVMYNTLVSENGQNVRLFTTLSVEPDQLGMPQRPSGTWTDFVVRHLGLPVSEATKTRRVWEVFVDQLQVSPDLLAIAGKTRLSESAATVERIWQEQEEFPHKLRLALFGEPNRCRHCGEYVYNVKPETCPKCGRPYEELKPKPLHSLQALLREYKAGPESVPPPYLVSSFLEHEEGDEFDVLRLQVAFEKNGETARLTWSIAVTENVEDVPEGMSAISHEWASDVEDWLKGFCG